MNPKTAFELLRRRGKSFAWASRLLPAGRRLGVVRLYAFCRQADDLADELPPEQAEARLDALLADLHAGRSADPLLADFLDLSHRHRLPRAAALHLLQALRADCRPRVLGQEDALLRYAYGVAGTVGLLISPLIGVEDPAAAPFAVDLGVAMQLTNIARDVLEDARRGRRYLPLPAELDCTPQAIARGDPEARRMAWGAIQDLLLLAEPYYQSAEFGMHFIPARERLAILTAARVYRAIGGRIQALGPAGYWAQRARVAAPSKARISLQAARDLPRLPAGERHDPALHRALTGLPGCVPA